MRTLPVGPEIQMMTNVEQGVADVATLPDMFQLSHRPIRSSRYTDVVKLARR
jgi:hypothetical protein